VNVNFIQPLLKSVWEFFRNLKSDMSFDPVIPHLGFYQKECKPEYNRTICTPLSIAALFTIVKLRKQSRCPTMDE
jgi:hypothetical protein